MSICTSISHLSNVEFDLKSFMLIITDTPILAQRLKFAAIDIFGSSFKIKLPLSIFPFLLRSSKMSI